MIRHSGKNNPTVRDFINVSGRGTVKEHPMFCGKPKQVADQMEEWFSAPACDGFVLAATNMPGAYDDVVRLLVPELQRRGLFHSDYEGPTLRTISGCRSRAPPIGTSPAEKAAGPRQIEGERLTYRLCCWLKAASARTLFGNRLQRRAR